MPAESSCLAAVNDYENVGFCVGYDIFCLGPSNIIPGFLNFGSLTGRSEYYEREEVEA